MLVSTIIIIRDQLFTFIAEVVIQIIIVFVGGAAFSVKPISGKYWGISIGLGLVSLPLGLLIRLIPNAPLQRFFVLTHIMTDPEKLPAAHVPKNDEKYNDAIENVRENLNLFANIRGGRVRASPSILNREKRKQAKNNGPLLPSLMAMVPSIVASSVAARWQPQTNRLHDPANGDPSKSSAALWDGKLSLHPDTESSHPAYALWKEQMEKRPSTGVPRRSTDRSRP